MRKRLIAARLGDFFDTPDMSEKTIIDEAFEAEKQVEKFDRSMIEHYLRLKDLNYLTDNDGDFQVHFMAEEGKPPLKIYFCAEGNDESVYSVRAIIDFSFPRSSWEEIMVACNQWNHDHRWPCAHLYIEDAEESNSAFISLENHLNLEEGVHRALFSGFTDSTVYAMFGFRDWSFAEARLFEDKSF